MKNRNTIQRTLVLETVRKLRCHATADQIYEEITKELFKDINRGVTLLDAQGGYSKENKKVIMCALRPQQVYKVNNIVKSIDENAFTIVTTAGTISGKGFNVK